MGLDLSQFCVCGKCGVDYDDENTRTSSVCAWTGVWVNIHYPIHTNYLLHTLGIIQLSRKKKNQYLNFLVEIQSLS